MQENARITERTSTIFERLLAIVLDLAVVGSFILIGKGEHNALYSLENYFQIGLPFVVAFFTVQLVLGKDQYSIKWGAIAGAISVPIAFFIRLNLPQVVGHEPYSFHYAFFFISYGYLVFCWVLWRFIANRILKRMK